MNLFFQNASELVEGAKILFAAKRYARAFSLAVLSLEELAKPVWLLNAVFFEKGDQEAWRALWIVLRSHEAKQWVWSAYGKRLEKWTVPTAQNYADRYPAGATGLLERFKQAGFYSLIFPQADLSCRTHSPRIIRNGLEGLFASLTAEFKVLANSTAPGRRPRPSCAWPGSTPTKCRES
jgi:AbiV family abortive infection protein